MSIRTRSRRQTLLRSAVATSALAGALLAPGTAFAAGAPTTGTPKADASVQGLGGELVKHLVLANGTKADLWKKGKASYWLDVYSEGSSQLGYITVGGPGEQTEDGEQIAGMWVTLNSKGQVQSWKNPASLGFAQGGSETRQGCTVSWHMATPFDGLSLELSNGPAGPVATLIRQNGTGKVATLTKANPVALSGGARIKAADDPLTPQFQMRVDGGVIPWLGYNFPAPLKDCGVKPSTPPAKPSATPKPAVSAHGGSQTVVVPKGGVAAGAEVAGSPNSASAWTAAGAGSAVLGAGGFLLLRRRSARQR
ncbi:hypothetical protein OG898_09030 [Streptomyces sp. NBC_00193]|uniref:hypothetical protein n=1 Tax=Streptomyces sp. NBC_00193 TaxID=2975675 RepID=UPI00225B1623|nr:hypothetical protein [Streptomyces sp. NBC_00193]MCX5296633.1 hypothetical protein [Streptomyces sp. NBC_00193]